MALTLGKMFPVEEALKVGLIDETASDKNDGMVKAEKFLNQFKKINCEFVPWLSSHSMPDHLVWIEIK